MKKAIGILLTNTGTPDSPSVADVRTYLKTFLSDPRVVRLPKILWRPLLNTVVLSRRTPYAAELYKKIWTEQGSPLRFITQNLAENLEKHLNQQFEQPIHVEVGMHYGNPSIPQGLEKLRARNLGQLVVLPLFPQYSTSTTETARDQTQAVLKARPDYSASFITHYAEHPGYIEALARQIRKEQKKDHYLLFSFHGLPQRFADQGDPYPEQCQQTAKRVAEALNLSADSWSLAYQSRFGFAKWLSPYTFETLKILAQKGIRRVSIVCPGFSVDCLETLEEIQIRGREEFLKYGGESYHYIPALNAGEEHIQALGAIVKEAAGLE